MDPDSYREECWNNGCFQYSIFPIFQSDGLFRVGSSFNVDKQTMELFRHHLYEYRKGLRNLILHTTRRSFHECIIEKLEKEGVDYIIQPVNDNRINIFFGAIECVDVIRHIGKANLGAYSAEEDFILGIMLGYDRLRQCQRFFKRKTGKKPMDSLAGQEGLVRKVPN